MYDEARFLPRREENLLDLQCQKSADVRTRRLTTNRVVEVTVQDFTNILFRAGICIVGRILGTVCDCGRLLARDYGRRCRGGGFWYWDTKCISSLLR